MSIEILPPYPVFPDIDGDPLENGFIYIGVSGLNAQANPIPVYWDSALTIPAAQPIRTIGGFASNNGTPGNLFSDSNYSIIVKNKRGELVYSALSSAATSGSSATLFQTIAIAKSASLPIGSMATVYGYYVAGDMPVSNYLVVAGGTGVEDGLLYHNMTNGRQLLLLHSGVIDIRQSGADITGNIVINDRWIAVMAALSDGGELIIPGGALCLVQETYRASLNMTLQMQVPHNNIRIRLDGELRVRTNNVTDYICLLLGKRKGSTSNAADYVENISIEGTGIIRGDWSFHTGVTGEGGHCLYISNSKNVVVRGIGLTGGWGDGIYIDALPYGPTDGESNFNSLPFNVVIDSVRSYQNRRNNISILNVDGIVVSNGKYSGQDAAGVAPHAGIDIEPDFVDVPNGFYCRGIRIIGNEISENYGSGIEISDTAAGIVNDVLIGFNTIRDCGDANFGFGGIRVVSPDGGGSTRVIGNEVFECFGLGIDIDGANAGGINGAGRVIVANNYVRGTKIGLKSAVNIAYGISARNGVVGAQIIGNLVELTQQHGIYIDGTGAACEDILVSANNVFCSSQVTDNTFDNIYVGAACTLVMVNGNTVRRSSSRISASNQPRYGINITTDYNHAINNDCYIGGKTKNLEMPFATLIPDDTSRHGLCKNNFGYVNETSFRTAAFSVSATGNFTIVTAHGLDTRGLDNATNAARILSQCQLTMVNDGTVGGNPVVVPRLVSIDTTNLTIAYTVVTAGSGGDNMRIAVQVQCPEVR